MAAIRPFSALRYRETNSDEFSKLISPPYDVISREKNSVLHARHPQNCIRLILGDPSTLETSELEDRGRYRDAAKRLEEWRKQGSLKSDASEHIYIQEDHFFWNGEKHSRLGIYCLLRLEDFGKGSVLPHEKTLSAPIQDRLELMKQTKAQLSPIFMVCDDPGKKLSRHLEEYIQETKPELDFSNADEDLHHRFWKNDDPRWTQTVQDILADQPFLIADGHHRYSTALHYSKNEGQHLEEAQWIMVYLCPTPNPGVVLSSIHRWVDSGISKKDLLKKANENFNIKTEALRWESFLASNAPFALLIPESKEIQCFFPKEDDLQKINKELQDIPTVMFNDLLLQSVLGIDMEVPDQQKRIRYIKHREEMAHKAKTDHTGLGFWLRPLDVHQVIQITKQGHLLPQKSTFFYPKVMSGMLFHLLG